MALKPVLRGGRELGHKGETLLLTVDNNRMLYNRLQSWVKNLANKMANGVYDRTKAIPAVSKYLMDEAAKEHHKNTGSSGAWNAYFSKEDRNRAAEYAVGRIESSYAAGELEGELTKAAKTRRAKRVGKGVNGRTGPEPRSPKGGGSFIIVLSDGREGSAHDMPRAKAWAEVRLQKMKNHSYAAFYRLPPGGMAQLKGSQWGDRAALKGPPWTEPFHVFEKNGYGNIMMGTLANRRKPSYLR
jgi:hypothetical protein